MLKISVILLVYNRPDLMRSALLSLNSQSLLPSEVIVTDDGSDVDILMYLKELAPALNYELNYVRQSNKGFRAAKARNNGVRASQYDFLVFYDQDIISTKNYLKTFIQHADPNKFIVSYPVRLTQEQTKLVNDSIISSSDYDQILRIGQEMKIKKQFLKDYYSLIKNKLNISKKGPKLRSGVFALNKKAFLKVNGFDEMYKGWGNEDDDLGNRLYSANIIGYNPFWKEFPIHLYHEANHVEGNRVNENYYKERKKIIQNGLFRCEYGLTSPLDEENIKVIKLT